MKAIYFDMDGTIADFYGVDGWLEALQNEYTKPYREAKSLVDMRALGKELNRLQRAGYTIGIISWGSRECTEEYLERIRKAKINWLYNHIKSVIWDEIHIIEYGKSKRESVNYPEGILFDDEEKNRKDWDLGDGMAFDVDNIIEILKCLF